MAKKNKRNEGYLSIQKKLIAAVAMLLVASFMVASSSYAWFTLSTAPEVTGIKTNVGANGSLEIALWTGTDPTSGVGDSTKDIDEKNKTWGNQIQLSTDDQDPYGLDKITLFPARLNVEDGANNTKGIASAPLWTPAYGADGRITELVDNTLAATYDDTKGSFIGTGKGVRAVGSASSMTQQQTDLRNAISGIDTALKAAKIRATEALTTDVEGGKTGGLLANIISTHATSTDTATESYDIRFLETVISKMEDSEQALLKAAKQYFLAVLAVVNKDTAADSLTAYAAMKSAIESATLTEINTLVTSGTITIGTTEVSVDAGYIPQTLKDYVAKCVTISETIEAANTAYTAVADKEHADWNATSSVVYKFINIGQSTDDPAKVTLNDINIHKVKEDENISKLVNAVATGKGLTLQLRAGSGVFADIAELAGDLTAFIMMNMSYGNLNVENLPCTMVTLVSVENDDAPLNAYDIKAGTTSFNADPAQGVETDKTLTDFYGYMIDLAFRTNADASNLMLQTTPVDRIYSSGGVEETLGSGSSMTFTSSAEGFTDVNIKELMAAIRIVFFNTDDNTIYAIGGLDTNNANVDNGAVTANIYLYEEYTFTADGMLVEKIVTDEQTSETTTTYLTAASLDTDAEKTALMGLDKNAVEKLSVMVYLDGDSVENGDVANATESMSGSMNLQFSSDANLKPMDYSPLQGDGSGNDETPSDTFKAVTGITGVPETGTAGTEVDLTTAVVAPTDATNTTIVWSITDAGTTGVTEITDGKFTPTTAGTIKVTATIANGATESTPYTQEFTITIS